MLLLSAASHQSVATIKVKLADTQMTTLLQIDLSQLELSRTDLVLSPKDDTPNKKATIPIPVFYILKHMLDCFLDFDQEEEEVVVKRVRLDQLEAIGQ